MAQGANTDWEAIIALIRPHTRAKSGAAGQKRTQVRVLGHKRECSWLVKEVKKATFTIRQLSILLLSCSVQEDVAAVATQAGPPSKRLKTRQSAPACAPDRSGPRSVGTGALPGDAEEPDGVGIAWFTD